MANYRRKFEAMYEIDDTVWVVKDRSQGRYADVVARCRDALDSLVPEATSPWADASNAERRKKMTLEDSFRLSWGAVRQITHATHHRNNLKSEFTRPMAQYVLGAIPGRPRA